MRSLLLALPVLVSAIHSSASGQDASATKGPVQHVVLVSIDGLAASYLNDPRAELPVLRKLAAEGAVAKGMITSFPSVTWPSHVTLATGVVPAKHGVIGNSVWDRKQARGVTYIGDPELTKDEAVRVPTLFDAAHAAGLKSGGVIWPCISGAKSLDWIIPDSGREDLHARFTTPGFVKELGEAGTDISKLGTWGWNKQYSTERDVLYTRVTQYLLEKKHANLVLVHLITPDGVEHGYGPHTPEAYVAVAESDRRVGEIWASLQKPPLAGKATLFVVSDHGFAPYEKIVRPNVVMQKLGLVTADAEGKVTDRQAWCVAQGGSAFLYVLDTARQAEIVAQLKEKFTGHEGVAAVLEPKEFGALGLPDPATNPQAPHLVLSAKPGYSFNDALGGEAIIPTDGLKGTHGHDPRPDYMHATFIAAGAGIKPGTKLDVIKNTDVAPTIARLLGLELKDVDGRVLEEILRHPGK
jgi:predicted AlkP superfamily pyrophosphatase or phosphodiesterase